MIVGRCGKKWGWELCLNCASNLLVKAGRGFVNEILVCLLEIGRAEIKETVEDFIKM